MLLRVGTLGGFGRVSGTTNWSTNLTLSDGIHTIQAYAVDSVGNHSTTQQIVICVDTSRPTVTITSPTNDQIVAGSFVVEGTANDSGVGIRNVYVRVGNSGQFRQASGTVSWSASLSVPVTGVTDVQVYVEDNAGNVSLTNSVTVRIDNDPPTVVISSPQGGSTVPSSFVVSGTASDTGGAGLEAVYLRVGVGNFSVVNGTSSWNTNVTVSSSGAYAIEVYAKDKVGNVSSTNYVSVNVDVNIPGVEILSPVVSGSSILTNVTSLQVSGTSVNAVSVLYRVGTSGSFSQASGITSWSANVSLGLGTNVIQVFATNTAGSSSITQQITIVVDNLSPTVNITSPTNNQFVLPSFVVSGTASDTGVSGLRAVYLRVGGSGAFGRVGDTSSWSTNLVITSSGIKLIEVYAEDNAGNISSTVSINVSVDADGPSVVVASPTNNQYVRSSFVVSGSASDGSGVGVSKVYLRVGTSGPFGVVSGTSSWSSNVSGLSEGLYVVQVYAEDLLGNVGATNSVSVTVDSSGPSVVISSPANNSTITNDLTAGGVLVQGTASDNNSVTAVYVSVDGGPFELATGTTTWSRRFRNIRETNINIVAYAVDVAGNYSTTNTNTVTVDRTYLGYGEYNFWASLIKDVYVRSGSGQLTIDVVISNAAGDNHNLYVLVDVTNMTTGHQPPATGWCGNWTTGWGEFWFTNTAGINADLVIWGWLNNKGYRQLMVTNANKIVNSTPSGVTVLHTMQHLGGADHRYSFTISYENIGSGAYAGHVANVYVLYGVSGDTNVAGTYGMRSIFPAGVSVVASGAWGNYIVGVTNKSIDYVLNP